MTAVTDTKSKVWLAPIDCQPRRRGRTVYGIGLTDDRSRANLERNISARCTQRLSNYVARPAELIVCVRDHHETQGRWNKILIIEKRQEHAKKDHCPA